MTIDVPFLDIQAIDIVRNNQLICKQFSLSVFFQERLAILGAEASGKSLLMRIMAGLLTPNAGRILWQGIDLATLSPINKMGKIGILFQNPDAHFLCATPNEETALTPTSQGLSHTALSLRIQESLVMAGFDERYIDSPLATLSASQRYRVAVAAVFAARPQLLLIDEPGAILSENGEIDFAQRLLVFGQTHGTTMVIFTSRATRAALFAQRIVQLTTG